MGGRTESVVDAKGRAAEPTAEVRDFLARCRVARLATAGENMKPLAIPICYVYDGEHIYTPIDRKPKRAGPRRLRRVRNILRNPWVSVLVDRWSEDWGELAHVVVDGRAEIIKGGGEYARALALLEEKYPQYSDMRLREQGLPVIKITPQKFISWGKLDV